MLFSTHTDYGSCLTIAARHQPVAIKHLLAWDKLSWQLINTLEDHKDFVRIGCIYNAEAVKWAIESDIDISKFMNNISGEPAIILASKYQPIAVQYILESKYGNADMLEFERNSRVCLDDAFDFQPKALKYIIESKHSSPEYLNREDYTGYRLIHKLQRIYPNISNIDEVKNNTLTQCDNIQAGEDDSQACRICYTYKTRVFFMPCGHTACVGCSFKLKKCHQCRELIQSRNIIF